MNHILNTFVYPAGWCVVLFLALVGAWRIVRGPGTIDRLVGIDSITAAVVAMVVLHSMQTDAVEFLELIIVVTALGFFTTVAFYYYLAQPGSSESADEFNREGRG